MNVRSDLTVLEMCGFSNSSVFSYPENGSRFLGKLREYLWDTFHMALQASQQNHVLRSMS